MAAAASYTADPRAPANLTAPFVADAAAIRAMLETRFGASELRALVANDAAVHAACGADAATDDFWYRLAGFLERAREHSLYAPEAKYTRFAPLDPRHTDFVVQTPVGVSASGGLAAVLAARNDRSPMQLFVRRVDDDERGKWSKHRGFGKTKVGVIACDVTDRWATLVFSGGRDIIIADLADLGAKARLVHVAEVAVHAAANATHLVLACANGAVAIYNLNTLEHRKHALAYMVPAAAAPSAGTHPLTGEPLEPAVPVAGPTSRVVHAMRVAFNQLAPATAEVLVSTREGMLMRATLGPFVVRDCVAMGVAPALDEAAPTRTPPLEPADALVFRHVPGADDCVMAQARHHLAYRCLGPLEAQIVASGTVPRYPTMWVPDAGRVLAVAVHGTTIVVHMRHTNDVSIGSLVPNPVEPLGNPFRCRLHHAGSAMLPENAPAYNSLFVTTQSVCCLLPDGTTMVARPTGRPHGVGTDTPGV